MTRLITWPGHAWLCLAARFYIGGVFIMASLHKIAHPELFALDVATYDILPLAFVNIVAITLPCIEIAAGVLLVVGWRVQGAALAIAGMMLVFTLALVIALLEGLDMSCGCFASQGAAEEDPITGMTVLRDLGWLAIALYVWWLDRHPFGLDRLLASRREKHG